MLTIMDDVEDGIEPTNTRVIRAYTDEDRAQLRALLMLGHTVPRAAAALSIPERTAYNWVSEWRELAGEIGAELRDSELRIGRRTDTLVEAILDKAEDGELTLTPHQTFVMWGIARDKVHSRLKVEQSAKGSSQAIDVAAQILALAARYREEALGN